MMLGISACSTVDYAKSEHIREPLVYKGTKYDHPVDVLFKNLDALHNFTAQPAYLALSDEQRFAAKHYLTSMNYCDTGNWTINSSLKKSSKSCQKVMFIYKELYMRGYSWGYSSGDLAKIDPAFFNIPNLAKRCEKKRLNLAVTLNSNAKLQPFCNRNGGVTSRNGGLTTVLAMNFPAKSTGRSPQKVSTSKINTLDYADTQSTPVVVSKSIETQGIKEKQRYSSDNPTLIVIKRNSEQDIAEHEKILRMNSDTQISGEKFLTQPNLDIANFVIQANKLAKAIYEDGYSSFDGIQQVLNLANKINALFEGSYQYKPLTLVEFYDHKVFKQNQSEAIWSSLRYLGQVLKNTFQFHEQGKKLIQQIKTTQEIEKKYTKLWDKEPKPSDNEIIIYMTKVAWNDDKVQEIARKFYRKKSISNFEWSEKIKQAHQKLFAERDNYWNELPESHPFKKRVNLVVKKIKATSDTNKKIELARSLGYNYYKVTDYWRDLPKPLRIALGKEREVHIYSVYKFKCVIKSDCENYFLSFTVRTTSLSDGKLESKEIIKFTTNFFGDIYVSTAPISYKDSLTTWLSGFIGTGKVILGNKTIVFNSGAINTPYAGVTLLKTGIIVSSIVAISKTKTLLPKKLLGIWELETTF